MSKKGKGKKYFLGGLTVIVLGFSLLTEGLLNLITVLTVVRMMHPSLTEVIDADCM